MRIQCAYCRKAPDEIEEYLEASAEANMMPDEYVRREEGTFNAENGHFACTDCYIQIGMPSSPRGWVAP